MRREKWVAPRYKNSSFHGRPPSFILICHRAIVSARSWGRIVDFHMLHCFLWVSMNYAIFLHAIWACILSFRTSQIQVQRDSDQHNAIRWNSKDAMTFLSNAKREQFRPTGLFGCSAIPVPFFILMLFLINQHVFWLFSSCQYSDFRISCTLG